MKTYSEMNEDEKAQFRRRWEKDDNDVKNPRPWYHIAAMVIFGYILVKFALTCIVALIDSSKLLVR